MTSPDGPSTSKEVVLKRRLGLLHAIAVICGLIIGSGIYVSPKGVLMNAGSVGLSLVLWGSCGFVSLLGALTFAEVGTIYTKAGEKYTYLREMYHPIVGFLYMWMYMMMFRPGANAIKCLTFGNYILQPFYPGCSPPQSSIIALACCLAALLSGVNIVNVKWSARTQTFCTAITLTSLIMISTIGIVWISQGKTTNLEEAFDGTSRNPGDVIIGLYSVVFASWGWNAMNFLIEELKDPYKNLPRAIIISTILVTILYVFTNLSFCVVLGKDGIINSNAVAVGLAGKTLGGAAFIMPIMIAISVSGSYNSGTLVGSRLCFAAAREGHLPAALAQIQVKFLSPIVALIFQLVLVIILAVAVDLYELLNNIVFANTLFDFLCAGGFVYLRYKHPDLHRPLKLPLAIPILFTVCMSFFLFIPLITKPQSCAIGLAIVICTGVPYYVLFVVMDITYFKTLSAKCLKIIQKACLCCPQDGEVKW